MPATEPPDLEIPIWRMLKLERAEKVVQAMARRKLPGLTAAELRTVTAAAGENAPLFDPDTLELDGWQRDHNRCWVPPNIHAIDVTAVRGKDLQRSRPVAASASGASGGSTPAQRLAKLTRPEFLAERQAIRDDELRKRWASDRENWIHRWDQRANVIDRWGGRQIP